LRSFLVLFLIIGLSGELPARSHPDYSVLIKQAKQQATPSARKILSTAHKMVADGIIIRGSCWDYLDTVFTRAGYPDTARHTVFHHPKTGPYVSVEQLRPGDWLYYINHSYGNVEHSGMFIGWTDRQHQKGLILSYGGERRNKPGRYRIYDLSSVYHITRATPD